MISKYFGTCVICGEEYKPGDQILWNPYTRSRGVKHVACAEKQAAVLAEKAAKQPAKPAPVVPAPVVPVAPVITPERIAETRAMLRLLLGEALAGELLKPEPKAGPKAKQKVQKVG